MWTRTKPDKAGWYWYREKADELYVFAVNYRRCVMITGICNPLRDNNNVVNIPVETFFGEWQPIEPAKE